MLGFFERGETNQRSEFLIFFRFVVSKDLLHTALVHNALLQNKAASKLNEGIYLLWLIMSNCSDVRRVIPALITHFVHNGLTSS